MSDQQMRDVILSVLAPNGIPVFEFGHETTPTQQEMVKLADDILSAIALSAQASAEPVAYLDIGAGGYIDIGSDLSDDVLMKLPKGRHMLTIVGTYGIDGYVPVEPPRAASPVVPEAIEPDDAPEMIPDDEEDMKNAYADGWNACRQALLATQSPAPEQVECHECFGRGIKRMLDGSKSIKCGDCKGSGKVPEQRTPAEWTLAGCKCVLYGKDNRHWPCPIHAPEQREKVELTPEEIDEIWLKHNPLTADHMEFASAVIAAHDKKQGRGHA